MKTSSRPRRWPNRKARLEKQRIRATTDENGLSLKITARKRAQLLLETTKLVEKLGRVPFGFRHRAACIIWWDKYADYPGHLLHPGLKQLVDEPIFVDIYPDEILLPFLVGLGYTQEDAQKRLTPIPVEFWTPLYV